MQPKISRRWALGALGGAAAAAGARIPEVDAAIVKRNDAGVEQLLELQITDASSRWCGGYGDGDGLYMGYSAVNLLSSFVPAFLHAQSKFYRSDVLEERIRLAAAFMERVQTPDGNFELLTTNFNSPPDTGFVIHDVATCALLLRRHGEDRMFSWMERALRRSGDALVRGGVHTPNHRWVVCAALAQLNELFPNPAYVRRIDQWLAEGIDIDADGQYSERSTTVYNAFCDRAFAVMALKLGRPELLEPVRRNLLAMLYLLHPGGEVVTEISRRQDRYQRGDMAAYWFPLACLAHLDNDGRLETLARGLAPAYARLSALMEYPILSQPGPMPAPLPEDYEQVFPAIGCARIRRGLASATILLSGASRFLHLRRGDAVVNAVRFASAFFGKGTFVPTAWDRRGSGFHLAQTIEADYYQPLDPPRKLGPDDWAATRSQRRRTEICRLDQSATVAELTSGFQVRIQSRGTQGVPVAVEINLREGGKLEGCEPSRKLPDAWVLPAGHATYRAGRQAIRFGPGKVEHSYLQVRGAEPKLSGPSVYLAGFTPFDHTVIFDWA